MGDIGTQYESHRMKKENDAQIRKIPLTKAARGHASALKKVGAETLAPKEQFKISKFKRIQCKVNFPGGKMSEQRRLASQPVEDLKMPEEIQEGAEAQQSANI